MIRSAKLFALVLMAGTMMANAETPAIASTRSAVPVAATESASQDPVLRGPIVAKFAADPVSAVRDARRWEFGPFLNGGVGLGNRSDFGFFSAGFQGGKVLTSVVHAGILSGQFELGANIMPLWRSYTPPPHEQTFLYPGGYFVAPDGGGTYTGVSLTPVILRWNFMARSRHIRPWFQGAGGLIYTTHKYPPDQLVPHGTPGGTSVFNFSPQGGGGFHYFLGEKRSIDVGVNGVHISSASLGDRNPGVNASVQIQIGYTFWK